MRRIRVCTSPGPVAMRRARPPTRIGAIVRHSSSSRPLDERAEQHRAALGQHAEQPAVGQHRQHRGLVDAVGSLARGVDHLGRPTSRPRVSAKAAVQVQDQRRHLGAGEQLASRSRPPTLVTTAMRRHFGLAAACRAWRCARAELGAGVVLDRARCPRRPG